MRPTTSDRENWKKMVLRSMPAPAWLGADAPENDVAISSRCRFARNLLGHRFPNHADADELKEICRRVREAMLVYGFEAFRRLTDAEREYMIGCRLMSPDFRGDAPGRLLLLNRERSVSIMVNEEDHVRLQAITPGWSPGTAHAFAESTLKALSATIQWAEASEWGILTASPFNAGDAIRFSAMFHLVGLAHTKRINDVLKALTRSGLTARGLFGESSRAVGAFFQVSSTRSDLARFGGACEYLMREERLARAIVPQDEIRRIASDAVRFAVVSSELSQGDALRVLAWVRFAVAAGLEGFSTNLRDIDALLSTMEVRNAVDHESAARDRAQIFRAKFESFLKA